MDLRPLCGICIKHANTTECKICRVNTCRNCKVNPYEIDIEKSIDPGKMPVQCNLCYLSIKLILASTPMYSYDENTNAILVFKDGERHTLKFDKCGIGNRLLIPHYKAKPIIDEIYFVKGVAQLIFDYYYEPRRYYPGEF